jgi:Tol biopolymer transport system component
VTDGRLKGKQFKVGTFLSPALSFDAKTVAFAYAERTARNPKLDKECWSPEQSFHVFKMNLDGTGLVQLTDGPWNDFDPCFLPNGRFVFLSERRGGFCRCGGRPVTTYTLHSMNADGSNIVTEYIFRSVGCCN